MKWILFLVLAAVPRIAAAQESPLETQSQTAEVATPAVGTEDSVFTSPLKEPPTSTRLQSQYGNGQSPTDPRKPPLRAI
jgi:hypothetical protein